jgi:hypothetical protein
VVARERAPEVPLLDADRGRLAAATVDHTRDQALRAQAPSIRGATALADLDRQLDALSGHGGEV